MNRKKRGEFSIEIIFVLLITIISITLLIGFMGTKLHGIGKTIYCKSFFYLYSSAMVPKGIRVEQSFCSNNKTLATLTLTKQLNTITTFSDGSESKTAQQDPLGAGTELEVELDSPQVISAAIRLSLYGGSHTTVFVDVDRADPSDFKFELNASNSPYTLNFTDALNRYLKDTQSSKAFLRVQSTDKEVIAHELKITYSKYFPKEELLGYALACWKLSDFGKRSKPLLCYEIIIPAQLRSSAVPVLATEEEITQMLLDEGVCDTLPNNDVDPECGNHDALDWTLTDIRDVQSVMIEYDAEQRKIVVS